MWNTFVVFARSHCFTLQCLLMLTNKIDPDLKQLSAVFLMNRIYKNKLFQYYDQRRALVNQLEAM